MINNLGGAADQGEKVMKRRTGAAIVLLASLMAAAGAHAQQPATPATPGQNPLDVVPEKMPFNTPYGTPISLQKAEEAIHAAIAEANKRGWQLNIAVVDSGGNLVTFSRMDGAQLASISVAEHKARASAQYRRETRVFESAIQEKGNLYVMTLDGMIGSRGGIPLVENGKLVGAIGCSGGTGSQDEVACKAAVATIK